MGNFMRVQIIYPFLNISIGDISRQRFGNISSPDI
jgi:hypothetical protein